MVRSPLKIGVTSAILKYCGKILLSIDALNISQIDFACPVTLKIWEELKKWLSPEIRLPPVTPQNAILGIVEDESHETDDIKLINHILLTFKHSLYNCRDALTLPNFFYVRERLKQAQKIEYKIAKDRNAPDLHLKKWERIIPKF